MDAHQDGNNLEVPSADPNELGTFVDIEIK